MKNSDDERFERLSGKRLQFIGTVDEIIPLKRAPKRMKGKQLYDVVFTDIYEKPTQKRFRQHNHILIDQKVFNKHFSQFYVKDNPKNICRKKHKLEFSAVIYHYQHKARFHPETKLYYAELGTGLKDPTGFKPVKIKQSQKEG